MSGHNGYGRTKSELSERSRQIVKMYESGISVPDIARAMGFKSCSTIYSVIHRNGIDHHLKKQGMILTPYKMEIQEHLRNGTAYAEIARLFQVSPKTVRNFCKTEGLELSEEQKAANNKRLNKRLTYSDEQVADIITSRWDGFEYVGGYVNNHSLFFVRCLKCGRIRTARLSEQPICRYCRQVEKEQRQKEFERIAFERTKEKEKRLQRKRLERIHQIEQKKHPCVVCGNITTRPKFCSNSCARKAENKNKELRRDKKLATAMIDTDITVKGLFKRDKGRCYICGLQCSLDDFIVVRNVTICGDWYPSIDHVIPLAKGGLHSWNNVRLAHRRCNYIKGDQVINDDSQEMEI